MAYLEIKDFNKRFGNTEVLKGINFTVNKGEVISIIGSSGSGKTTLLRCINFLEQADTGTMTLDDEVLFDASEKGNYTESDLRKKRLNFGLVFQSFNLFPQYTVYKNIILAPVVMLKERANRLKKENEKLLKAKVKAMKSAKTPKKDIKAFIERESAEIDRQYKAKRAEIDTEAEALLVKVGLAEKRNSYPSELSGGQQQRVAIARALALKPKVLCFDEPTSALDPELTGEVLKVIKSLKGADRTMIIVTHEMGFAKKVSDKVIFMADGVVEEQGTPSEVFDNPKSEKLISFLSHVDNKDGD